MANITDKVVVFVLVATAVVAIAILILMYIFDLGHPMRTKEAVAVISVPVAIHLIGFGVSRLIQLMRKK